MRSLNAKPTQRLSAVLAAVCACLIGFAALTAVSFENAYPPDATLGEVQAIINQAPKTHPRLYLDQQGFDALRKSVDEDPATRDIKAVLLKSADRLMDNAPIERKLTGRRLLGQSRRCVDRVVRLAMAYQLTGEKKYADRAGKEMLAAANFSDWNPSHFLDTAEMTFALAVGYDWLYHELDGGARQAIRTAILEKGVKLPFETKHNGWVRSTNNWGQVCHGGLTAGALAVLEDEPELAAKTVHNALQNVTRSIEAFAPKGSYPEGPGYWSYGSTYNVALNDVIESVLGTDFGLGQAPGFDQTGQYLSMVTGPSGMTFNYADGGAGRGAEPAVFWFAKKFNRPDWLIQETALLREELAEGSSGGRFFPFTLIWADDFSGGAQNQMPLHWSSGGHVPITIHRSSWTDPNRVFIGFKGGSPSANHGNMDTGSFVLDADGVRWAMDLGAEGYNGIEQRGMNLWDRSQESDRWTIFRQQNHGHNTLVIDGQLQVAENEGTFIQFSHADEFAHSIMDLSGVYEGQAKSAKRGIMLLPSREVLIRDELTGLKPGAKVRWGMVTPAQPGEVNATEATLEQTGKTLSLRNLSPDSSAKWAIIDTATPRNEWDSPNKGTCMMALEETAPADGNLTITVLLTPGSVAEPAIKLWKHQPLKDW